MEFIFRDRDHREHRDIPENNKSPPFVMGKV